MNVNMRYRIAALATLENDRKKIRTVGFSKQLLVAMAVAPLCSQMARKTYTGNNELIAQSKARTTRIPRMTVRDSSLHSDNSPPKHHSIVNRVAKLEAVNYFFGARREGRRPQHDDFR